MGKDNSETDRIFSEYFSEYFEANGKYKGNYITIKYEDHKISDHQGHIVPDNKIRSVCDNEEIIAIAKKIKKTFNIKDSNEFDVIKSIIIWNPINICSAPTDEKRGQYPKNDIDNEVAYKIMEIHADANITESLSWRNALRKIILKPEDMSRLVSYVKESLNLLLSQDNTSDLVYHLFEWEKITIQKGKKEVLVPSEINFIDKESKRK